MELDSTTIYGLINQRMRIDIIYKDNKLIASRLRIKMVVLERQKDYLLEKIVLEVVMNQL